VEGLTVLTVKVSEAAHVSEARRVTVRAAAKLGFDEKAQGNMAIAMTEAATNLLKHAGGGEVIVRGVSGRAEVGLEMLVFDSGPGMTDIGACLRDGYSTAGSMGSGLGAISRLSGSSAIYTLTGQGTIVQAFWQHGEESLRPKYDIAMIQMPKPGEVACGDFCASRETHSGALLMIADGLGHGTLAAEASMAAGAVFHQTTGSPAQLLEAMHAALRGSRGAAIGIAEIDRTKSLVRFAGLGNIAGVVVAPEQTRHMVSMNGIVGVQAMHFREFELPWTAASVVVLHSDGISGKWDLSRYPGIGSKPSSMLAAALYRDFRRLTDDASVIVAKINQST
jgi:anti-sigma regulatory factor (Ser/Thr protein kinase)